MRTSKTFSIQFWMDTKKSKKSEGLIYARINVDQKRLSISGLTIFDWTVRREILG